MVFLSLRASHTHLEIEIAALTAIAAICSHWLSVMFIYRIDSLPNVKCPPTGAIEKEIES